MVCEDTSFIGDPNKPQYIYEDEVDDDEIFLEEAADLLDEQDIFYIDPDDPEYVVGNIEVDDDDPEYDPDEFGDFLSDSDESTWYEGDYVEQTTDEHVSEAEESSEDEVKSVEAKKTTEVAQESPTVETVDNDSDT